MAKAELIEAGEKVSLELSLQQSALLFHVLGRFNPDSSGPLKEIYEELEDLGIENYENVFILNQNEPTLYLVVQPVDKDEEE